MTGLAHNHNERISVANLEFGTRILYDVVTRFCGAVNNREITPIRFLFV